jgi:hypothetical protein
VTFYGVIPKAHRASYDARYVTRVTALEPYVTATFVAVTRSCSVRRRNRTSDGGSVND